MFAWFNRQLLRKQDGFTLIELMVVVAIMAVLAFLVVPRVLDAMNRAKLNSAISTANEIANAIERQAAENGEATIVAYPAEIADWSDLVAKLRQFATIPEAAAAMKHFQGEDATATEPLFEYSVTTDGKYFAIELKAADRDGTFVCVYPGGVYTDPTGCKTADELKDEAEPAS